MAKKIYVALWAVCGLSWLATATNFYFDTYLYFCRAPQCRFADAMHAYFFAISLVLLPALTIAAVIRWARRKSMSVLEGLTVVGTWGLSTARRSSAVRRASIVHSAIKEDGSGRRRGLLSHARYFLAAVSPQLHIRLGGKFPGGVSLRGVNVRESTDRNWGAGNFSEPVFVEPSKKAKAELEKRSGK